MQAIAKRVNIVVVVVAVAVVAVAVVAVTVVAVAVVAVAVVAVVAERIVSQSVMCREKTRVAYLLWETVVETYDAAAMSVRVRYDVR